MPPYAFLLEKSLSVDDIAEHLRANVVVGVPYSEDMIENAQADLRAQSDPDGDHEELLERYPNATVGDLDGRPGQLTEMDAMVAYLQVLGQMVDFEGLSAEDLRQ